MHLRYTASFATLLVLTAGKCQGATAPKTISLGFVPSSSGVLSAFLDPLKKSFAEFINTPSIITELKDRIVVLERKIRASKEEARQLRSLLNQQRDARRRIVSSDAKQSVEVERVLQDQMKLLNVRVEELSQIKGKMEALLKKEQDHASKLEKMLAKEQEDKILIHQTHREELDKLRKEITAESKEKMKEFEKGLVAKMTLEVEKLKNELALERAKSARLEQEKQQAEAAVEQEKVKMRKLVKVLATKEKQEIAQSSPSSSTVPITQTVGSSSMKSRKVTSTGRGLMPK